MNGMQGKQGGGSAIATIISLVILGLAIYAAIQYVPQRIEASAVGNILDNVKRTHSTAPASNEDAVWSTINKLLDVNQMHHMRDSFAVTQQGSTYIVTASYDRELNLVLTSIPLHYEETVKVR